RNILKLVLSSPRDVAEERDIVELVAAELNKGVAADYNVLFEVVRWETDAFPGFHKAGPQGLIDPILDIENCDILIGIFWQRFGTPTRDAGSGTEHEFMKAYESWKQKDSPQIMMYFKDAEVRLATAADAEQYRKVHEFREKFPEEGLYWRYGDSRQFERLVRNHLTQFLKHQTPNERVFTKHKGDKTDEYRYIRSYCLKLKERFSTINLFGEGDSADENMGRVMKRMRRVETGFVPLHLQDWHDEIDKCERARLEIADIFFAQDADRLVLVRGLPGSGKTTLLRYLVYHYASMGAEGKECIPVYMRCKDISATDTLEEFVLQQINQESESKLCYEALTGPSYFLEKPMVLLFDGLDEIEDRQTSDNVRQGLVLLKKKYPRCHVIITSRPIKLQREDFPQFRHLDLLRLDADMISEYIKKWFGRDTSKITNLQRALVSRPRIKALAGNPFLLSMICFTYQNGGETELIERRSDLYANCTKYLLQRRYDSSTLMDSEEDYVQLLKILKDISLRFFLWQEADFGIDHVNVIGKRYLTAEVLGKTSDFLDDVQQQTGLLQRAKEGFTFVHRSLWEYFTALALIDKKSDDFVIRHAANPDWEEVVRLYAGLLREDEKVKALVNGLWTINRPLALRVTT
ncbi:NACHT domain-containing protein, partial [candidate division KSB1 bacterium]